MEAFLLQRLLEALAVLGLSVFVSLAVADDIEAEFARFKTRAN